MSTPVLVAFPMRIRFRIPQISRDLGAAWIGPVLAGSIFVLLPALVGETLAAAPRGLLQPRVFNGIQTFEQPAVGVLLRRTGVDAPWRTRCTVTLIRPGLALTAAHCVCDGHGSQCQPGGVYAPDPGTYRVLWQTDGLHEVSFAAVPRGFDFPEQDIAVLALAGASPGLTGLSPASAGPAPGTRARLVGFGSTSAYGHDTGVKRGGNLITAACGDQLDDQAFLCWESDGSAEGANSCLGDSGAPVLLDAADGTTRIAGVVSGGYGPCDGEDLAFATAVDAHAVMLDDLIAAAASHAAGADAGSEQIGTAGMTRLVAALNGVDASGNRALLELAHEGSAVGESADCTAADAGMFQVCTMTAPTPGVWHARASHRAGGGGEAQLSVTAYVPACNLDLDADGHVDALTDGVLLLRWMAGRTGDALVAGALSPQAGRTDAEAIGAFLASANCRAGLDVDADGRISATRDGQLILRYLFGLRGDDLTRGMVGGSGQGAAQEMEQRVRELLR